MKLPCPFLPRAVTAVAVTGLVTFGMIFMTPPSLADSDHDMAKRLKDAGEIQQLETILERAKQEHPGRVLETELEHKGKRFVYELEILGDDGVVRELYYDAKTGELLKSKEER